MNRTKILNRIHQGRPTAVPLPTIDTRQFGAMTDRVQSFRRNVVAVGGKVLTIRVRSSIAQKIAELFPDAKVIVSLIPDAQLTTVDLKRTTTARDLERLDLAILPGQLAVAENGAVWVAERNLPHRSIPFIASHVVIVVQQDQIVEHMHEACSRLADFDQGYGVFISGPSKTADIEQSLVIGAQGPLSLTVILVEESSGVML